MKLLLAAPFFLRVAGAFAAGAVAGSLVNLAAYALASRPRPISPWSRPAPQAPPRRWLDRVPILGWLGLRRESFLHGPSFWVRPMVVELLAGLGCAWLYWWYVARQGLLPLNLLRLMTPELAAILHAQFASHMVLILLMAAASLIDADEKTIPDAITIPGTLFGLAVAAGCPWALLPVVRDLPNGRELLTPLTLSSPHVWPDCLRAWPNAYSLLLALACWWLWCFAILPRTWYSRHGWYRAWKLLCARLKREPSTRWTILGGLVGSAIIYGVWRVGGLNWIGLLSALVGMAGSGGLVWAVRIIGAVTLRREAMGFGDVTLMAMLGTILGWQTCLVVFFVAPLVTLGVAFLRLILRREREIPYGPFLCLAALIVLINWATLWPWLEDRVFILGIWVPAAVVVCLGLLGVLLAAIDRLRRLLFPSPADKQRH